MYIYMCVYMCAYIFVPAYVHTSRDIYIHTCI